jgi:YD repeat-containing protein
VLTARTPIIPHAPKTVGSDTYTYDTNGNVLSGGGRTYTWNALNLPTSVTGSAIPLSTSTPNGAAPSRGGTASGSPNAAAPSRGGTAITGAVPNYAAANRGTGTSGGTTESYTYDADGNRLTRTVNGGTTLYIGGVYELDYPSAVTRSQYAFNGAVIAQRTSTDTNPLTVSIIVAITGSIPAEKPIGACEQTT